MTDCRWAVGWETTPWTGTAGTAPVSRSQRSRLRATYDAAVPARIASLLIEVDAAVLGEADDARAEIARFDAELRSLLPAAEITPLAAVLLRTESASSSQIENITVGAKALAAAEIGIAGFGSNAALVAANVTAMRRAIEVAEPMSPQTILAIHELLMRGQDHAGPGKFRTEQVWVGGSSVSPHGAAFVPPRHHHVVSTVEDLCTFAARTDVPLLIQTAIAHAQFETIHPFNDGNGRTGRALVHAMLRHGGATTRGIIPISAGLLLDTSGYFAALSAYREGDLNPIVSRFIEASFASIGNGRRLAQELAAIHEQWTEQITSRRSSAIWRLLPMLLSGPAVTSRVVQDLLGLSQPAADRLISHLSDAGVLRRVSGHRRYVVWVATEVTDALDRFAARARRAG